MNHTSAFIRTDKAIMNTFIQLLKEKSFEKITVQDIIEKTPVTRATFYAHYKDKYEIAEKMLDIFMNLRDEFRNKMMKNKSLNINEIMIKNYNENIDLFRALLKIRTDTTDLRQKITDEFMEEYLKENKNCSILEAKIYAQVRSELEISIISREIDPLSFDEQNTIFINAFLKLLRIPNDKDVEYLIKKKIKESVENNY